MLYDNLWANTAYEFEIVAIVGNKESGTVEQGATTHEAPPGVVGNLDYQHTQPDTSTAVTVSWEPPLAPNGQITGYLVGRNGLDEDILLPANQLSYR